MLQLAKLEFGILRRFGPPSGEVIQVERCRKEHKGGEVDAGYTPEIPFDIGRKGKVPTADKYSRVSCGEDPEEYLPLETTDHRPVDGRYSIVWTTPDRASKNWDANFLINIDIVSPK